MEEGDIPLGWESHNKGKQATMSKDKPLSRKQVQDLLRKKKALDSLDLRGANLAGIVFDGASLRQTKLAEANMKGCSFRQADLTGASLWNAELPNAVFEGAILDEADLDQANLEGCNFKGARLRKAILPHGTRGTERIMDSVKNGLPVHFQSMSFS